MRRRIVLAALLVLTALALGASTAFAQGVKDVFPFDEATVTINPGDQIHIFWYWVAQTKGQVRVYLNHTSHSFVLRDEDGDVVWSLSAHEARQHFDEIGTYSEDDSVIYCPKPTVSSVGWNYTLPFPEAGVYQLVLTETFGKPVNDGFHTCYWVDTGEPVATPPSLYRGTQAYTTTIIVEP